MTAPQSATPGTGTADRCRCKHSIASHDSWGKGPCAAIDCDCREFPAPSPVDTTEPPAEWKCSWCRADSPVTTSRCSCCDAPRSSTEAQQDDELPWLEPFYEWARTDKSPGSYSAAFAAGWRAARPPAGSESLRVRIEKLAKQYQRLSEELHLVPAADAFADAALDLRRALGAR